VLDATNELDAEQALGIAIADDGTVTLLPDPITTLLGQ
jgi:hypothetical protein